MTRRELRLEIDELRAALGLRQHRTIEGETLPPALRDSLTARAFIAEWGDKGRALIRLGFPALNRLRRTRATSTKTTPPEFSTRPASERSWNVI
jgi:hypothetical protein